MELEIYWTRFAQDKLDDIYNYYEIKASRSIAKKLVAGIIDQTIELGGNPKDRKSTRLNSSHIPLSRMPSSA